MFDDPNVVLHCEKIDKIYPGTKALDQVSFDLLKGKVNVLIGDEDDRRNRAAFSRQDVHGRPGGLLQGYQCSPCKRYWNHPPGAFSFPEYDSLPEYFYGT